MRMNTMNETFKVEPTGRRSKRRWNVWKYRVIGKGMERTAMGPENKDPFRSSEDAFAFRNRVAPNQPEK